MSTLPKCCVCDQRSYKEICDECNAIYNRVIGATFDTEEDLKAYMEYEDIPKRQLRELGRELSANIFGGN